MKICAYCTTRNRDEAIFCSHCRRPLQEARIPKDTSFIRLLAVLVLLGLGSYLFLSHLSSNFLPGTPPPNLTMTSAPPPTHAGESITIYTCVEESTNIRRGPSTQTETIGGLTTGTCLRIIGRTEDSSWVYIVSDDHQSGWVSVAVLPVSDSLANPEKFEMVSVRDNSTLANPARATLTSAEIAHGAQANFTKIAATNIPDAPFSAYKLPCFDAVNRVGDYISCKIERAYCDYLPEVEDSPTYCNDRPYPDHSFALVTYGADWSEYDGKCLIVEGYLKIDRGVLSIQASKRSQVSLCE